MVIYSIFKHKASIIFLNYTLHALGEGKIERLYVRRAYFTLWLLVCSNSICMNICGMIIKANYEWGNYRSPNLIDLLEHNGTFLKSLVANGLFYDIYPKKYVLDAQEHLQQFCDLGCLSNAVNLFIEDSRSRKFVARMTTLQKFTETMFDYIKKGIERPEYLARLVKANPYVLYQHRYERVGIYYSSLGPLEFAQLCGRYVEVLSKLRNNILVDGWRLRKKVCYRCTRFKDWYRKEWPFCICKLKSQKAYSY